MPHPDLDGAGKPLAAARVGADIEGHRVGVGAAPIGPGVAVVEDVELGDGRVAQHGDERRAAAPMLLDHLGIGEEQRAVM